MLTAPYDSLFEQCLHCGNSTPDPRCAGCQPTSGSNSCDADTRIGARAGTGERTGPWVLTQVLDRDASYITDTGARGRVKLSRIEAKLALLPVVQAGVAERLLLAVPHWRVPEPAAQALLQQALHAARSLDPAGCGSFARRALASGNGHLLAELELSATARCWLQVEDLVHRGQVAAAARRALELPPGRYAASLGIWCAAAEHLDAGDRSAILARLDAYPTHDAAHLTAVAVVRDRLRVTGPDTSSAAEQLHATVDAARPGWWRQLVDQAATQGTSPSGEVLAALRSPGAGLRGDPELVAKLPPDLIDDLIDDGVIDAGVAASTPSGDLASYLLARTDPTQLDEARLKGFGLHAERARRALAEGRELPPDLPTPIETRFAPIVELGSTRTRTCDEVLEVLAAHDQHLAAELRTALEQHGALPREDLLRRPFARWAAHRLAANELSTQPLQRDRLSQEQQRFVGEVEIDRGRRALGEWEYDRVLTHAKSCLARCGDLAVRAEALNLLAVVAWLRGQDHACIAALRSAVDTAPTPALRANLAIAAQDTDPGLAAEQFTLLIDAAPTTRDRIEVAAAAIQLWHASTGDGQGAETDPPRKLLTAVRRLTAQPMREEELAPLARWLVGYDREWMAAFDRRVDARGPTVDVARLYAAMARGFEPFLEVLAGLVRRRKDVDWIAEAHAGIIEEVIEGSLDPETGIEFVDAGELLIDSGLQLEARDRMLLRALLAFNVARYCNEEDDAEPDTRFLDALIVESRLLMSVSPDERETLEPAFQSAFGALAVAHGRAQERQLQEAAEVFRDLVEQISNLPRWSIDRQAVLRCCDAVEDTARQCRDLMGRFRATVPPDVEYELKGLLAFSEELLRAAQQMKREI